MKRAKLLVVALVATLFATGCGMKMNLDVVIDKDKNINFSVIMAMDNELIDSMLSMDQSGTASANPTDKDRWAYVDEAFKDSLNDADSNIKPEKYEKGEFKGYKISAPAGKIDTVTKESASAKVNLADMFNGDLSFDDSAVLFTKDGDKYVSNITFDGGDNESLAQMNQYSSSMDLFEMNFVITLPVKPESTNADKVDGKTLTWDLSKGAKDIEFTFDFNAKDSDDNKMLYIIGGCVAAIGVVAIAAVVIMNNKKKKVVAE